MLWILGISLKKVWDILAIPSNSKKAKVIQSKAQQALRDKRAYWASQFGFNVVYPTAGEWKWVFVFGFSLKRDRQMTKVGKMLIGDLFVMSANISNNVTGGFIMGLPPFHMDTFFFITKTIKNENYF